MEDPKREARHTFLNDLTTVSNMVAVLTMKNQKVIELQFGDQSTQVDLVRITDHLLQISKLIRQIAERER